jgi:hypothetical protein
MRRAANDPLSTQAYSPRPVEGPEIGDVLLDEKAVVNFFVDSSVEIPL